MDEHTKISRISRSVLQYKTTMGLQPAVSDPPAASLWQETANAAQDHPSFAGKISSDVTVVGAGFTGLRAALHLAEAGSRVVVLDASDVGFGASGRTGGQVNPMLPVGNPAALERQLGRTYFERLTETSLSSADELFDLIDSYQIACRTRQNGWLRVCHNPRAFERAKEGVAAWNRFGAGMEIIQGDEVTRLSGSRADRSGVVTPRGGAVHPLSLARGLAETAKARGAATHGKNAVQWLQRRDDRWIAQTAAGSVTSE